jgi:guanylate kinase
MACNGNLFIVSGPSGAGKSAIAARVLEAVPGLQFSISYTTRQPRGAERDGIEYHFVAQKEFEALIAEGEFLEWALVYGNHYGTPRRFIEERLSRGLDVLLDVDVQGAGSIRQKRPDAITIFIMPPAYHVLRDRLEQRKLDKDYVIAQRLKTAGKEIRRFGEYDYLVINEDLSRSVDEVRGIVLASRCRLEARRESAQSIIATFGGLDAEDP